MALARAGKIKPTPMKECDGAVAIPKRNRRPQSD